MKLPKIFVNRFLRKVIVIYVSAAASLKVYQVYDFKWKK